MSLAREEDRPKNGCSSRGLGVAAAAIGVGVGAALYYFFNKRAENPNAEGSTSDWNCERPQPFSITHGSDESYTTISEHETSDTSINEESTSDDSFEDPTRVQTPEFSEDSDRSDSEDEFSPSSDSFADSNSEMDDFDVTTSSLGVPEYDGSSSPGRALLSNVNWAWISTRVSPRWHRTELTEEQQMAMIREEQFRERSWTLEDCSICFDVMLRNQDVTRLPCTHNFHTECILPWLQEKQTCPICRKNAE